VLIASQVAYQAKQDQIGVDSIKSAVKQKDT